MYKNIQKSNKISDYIRLVHKYLKIEYDLPCFTRFLNKLDQIMWELVLISYNFARTPITPINLGVLRQSEKKFIRSTVSLLFLVLL